MWLHLGSEHGGALQPAATLLFHDCDSVAAEHAVSGAHQHAVECSLRDIEKMFLHAVAVAVALAIAVGVAVAVAVAVPAADQCKKL